MPYINQKRRTAMMQGETPKVLGEVNYLITCLMDAVLNEHGVSYENINGLIGVLECAKLELYRRIASPYEDIKKIQNGEVFTCLDKPLALSFTSAEACQDSKASEQDGGSPSEPS